MTIQNLTPHDIVIRTATGDVKLPPCGQVARVATIPGKPIGEFEGIHLFSAPEFGEVAGLPAPEEGVIFIVSALVAQRCIGRKDVFSPDTGPTAIREGGQIVAVKGLVQAPQG